METASRATRARHSALRTVPAVERLIALPAARALVERYSRPAVLAAIRTELQAAREAVLATGAGEALDAERHPADALLDGAAARLREERSSKLRRTINATGIVLHTNLGRAPVAEPALAAVAEVARGYANLELDLASGRRGSRTPAPPVSPSSLPAAGRLRAPSGPRTSESAGRSSPRKSRDSSANQSLPASAGR